MTAASLIINTTGGNTILVQQMLQLTATAKSASGATLAGQTVRWTSSDTTIASVSASGWVTGKQPGSVTITAACDGAQSETQLTVLPPVAAVVVDAQLQGRFAVGGTIFYVAQPVDMNGQPIAGLPIVWSSSDTSVATIVPGPFAGVGQVTAVAVGNASIAATIGGVSGTAIVTVVPQSVIASVTLSPDTVTFLAAAGGFRAATQMVLSVVDAQGSPVIGLPVTWSISDTSAATVSATGLLTPNPAVFFGSMATAALTATAGGQSASVPVFVCPPVASIALSTTSIDLSVGQSITLVATPLDAHGNPERVALSHVIFNPDGQVVTVQPTGFDTWLVTGVAAGTATLDVGGIVSVAIAVGATESAAERDNRLH